MGKVLVGGNIVGSKIIGCLIHLVEKHRDIGRLWDMHRSRTLGCLSSCKALLLDRRTSITHSTCMYACIRPVNSRNTDGEVRVE